MALIEGGNFICYRHNFETGSIDEWNEHCDDGDHFEQGTALCVDCGESISFENLPFQRYKPDGTKALGLKCDECSQKTVGNVKVSKKPAGKEVVVGAGGKVTRK